MVSLLLRIDRNSLLSCYPYAYKYFACIIDNSKFSKVDKTLSGSGLTLASSPDLINQTRYPFLYQGQPTLLYLSKTSVVWLILQKKQYYKSLLYWK